MAKFKLSSETSVNGESSAGADFFENDIPDEIIREYRTYVETKCAIACAEASIIILDAERGGDDPRAAITAATRKVKVDE